MGSNDVKTEFKEFIQVLSTEICKQVLLEELKDINNSFNKTEKDYKVLCDKYSKNIKDIRDQIMKLQNKNTKLDDLIITINNNNYRINDALQLIHGDHKKVMDTIVNNNKVLFNEYSEKIQNLNDQQRQQFVSAIINTMSVEGKKNIEQLKTVISEGKIKDISQGMLLLDKKVEKLNLVLTDATRDMKLSHEKFILEFNTSNKSFRDEISRKMGALEVTVNKTYKKSLELEEDIEDIYDKILLYEEKSILTNRLLMIVGVISLIILFFK